MQRPLENIIFDDSFRNIFPAAAFRRYRFAQPTAKRRLSLRETLLMSSMGTVRTATISIPDASRSPFQAPLQLRDGALREILRDDASRCRGEWKLARKVEIFSRREKSIFSRGLSRGETHGLARLASVSRRESSTLLQDDSFRNIFPATAFRRLSEAIPTAKRRLSLREILRDDAGWDLPRQGQDVVNRGQRRRCARGAKHRPILRNPETGCTTPYHATTH